MRVGPDRLAVGDADGEHQQRDRRRDRQRVAQRRRCRRGRGSRASPRARRRPTRARRRTAPAAPRAFASARRRSSWRRAAGRGPHAATGSRDVRVTAGVPRRRCWPRAPVAGRSRPATGTNLPEACRPNLRRVAAEVGIDRQRLPPDIRVAAARGPTQGRRAAARRAASHRVPAAARPGSVRPNTDRPTRDGQAPRRTTNHNRERPKAASAVRRGLRPLGQQAVAVDDGGGEVDQFAVGAA